jgi:hypothetical protein
MIQLGKKMRSSLGLVSSPHAVILLLACSLTACGSGSDDAAVSGSLTRASTTVVSGKNEIGAGNVSAPGQARRAVPYDFLVNSTNPATKNLLAAKCAMQAKQAKFSPGLAKLRYGASTRQSLRQSACAAIAAR